MFRVAKISVTHDNHRSIHGDHLVNPELKRAAEIAAEYIESIDQQKVSEEPDPRVLRDRLSKELTADGLPPLQVINELAQDARDGF